MVSAKTTSRSVGAPNEVPEAAASAMAVEHHGRRVAEDQRPPGADVVDVLVAVDVPDAAALAAGHERRLAADGAEGADRGCSRRPG